MNGNEESDKLVKVQIMKLLSVHKLLTEPCEPVDILILVQTNNITSRVKKHICFLDRWYSTVFFFAQIPIFSTILKTLYHHTIKIKSQISKRGPGLCTSLLTKHAGNSNFKRDTHLWKIQIQICYICITTIFHNNLWLFHILISLYPTLSSFISQKCYLIWDQFPLKADAVLIFSKQWKYANPS